MTRFISRAALAGAALALGFAQADAVTTFDTKQLNVQVSVSGTCSITDLTNVSFPAVVAGVPFSTETTTGTVTVLCTDNAYSVNADAGQNAGTAGDVTTRNLKAQGGTATLAYHLYEDNPTNTVEWGNATSGTPFSGSASATATTFTFGAKLPGATPTASGVYADVVTVTLTN